MNDPFRDYLPNSFSVNKNISVLNRKLQILVKVFAHILESANRKLFTNPGLHRNKLGKKLVNFQLALFLLTTFDQKTLHPVSLGWYETSDGDNLHCDVNQVKTFNRNLSRNRKMSFTRSNDFLWLIYFLTK
jgi:restriction endonuclease